MSQFHLIDFIMNNCEWRLLTDVQKKGMFISRTCNVLLPSYFLEACFQVLHLVTCSNSARKLKFF